MRRNGAKSMKLNPLRMEQAAGAEEYAAGRELEEAGRVKVAEQDGTRVKYTVAGQPPQTVTIDRDLTVRCDCILFVRKGCCRHAVAAWLEAERAKIPESMLQKSAPKRAEELTTLILREMPAEANVRMEVTLALPKQSGNGRQNQVGFRVGTEKLYVMRDPASFLFAMDNGQPLQFGKDFIYEPSWMHFSEDDERVLELIRKLLSVRGQEAMTPGGRMIAIPDPFVKELLEGIGETPLRIMDDEGKIIRCRQIRKTRLPLQFGLNLGPRGLDASARMPADFTPLTEDCSWIMTGGHLIETEDSQRELIRMLWKNQYEGRCLFHYPLEETGRVIGEVLPYLKIRGAVEIGTDLRNRLVRLPLQAQVYLDREGKSVIASVVFRYGEIELNPFAPEEKKIALGKDEKLLLRDAEAEHNVLDILANSGFRVRKENIRLSGSDAVFDFVSNEVQEWSETNVIRYNLYREEETGTIVRLGLLPADYDLWQEGDDFMFAYSAVEPWLWPAVEGVTCAFDVLTANRPGWSEFLGNIPVMIDGEYGDLRCGYNEYENQYTVYGLWDGYDSNTGMFNRNVRSLAQLAGQEFAPVYPIFDGEYDSGDDWFKGQTLKMYRTLEVTNEPLPAGTYYIEYVIYDMFMRPMFLDWARMDWDGQTATFPDADSWQGEVCLNPRIE